MTTKRNELGLYYEPIEALAIVGVHNDRQMNAFLEETKIVTLSELLAKVVVFQGNLYVNVNLLRNPSCKRLHGFGRRFIAILHEILRERISGDCRLKVVHSLE